MHVKFDKLVCRNGKKTPVFTGQIQLGVGRNMKADSYAVRISGSIELWKGADDSGDGGRQERTGTINLTLGADKREDALFMAAAASSMTVSNCFRAETKKPIGVAEPMHFEIAVTPLGGDVEVYSLDLDISVM